MRDRERRAGASGRIRAGARRRDRPPIPIEDIIEKHLKIGIEFDDMHRLFEVPRSGFGFEPDILGAIFFDERRIVIDESLDPEENPSKEGRYRFTLAHEVGHWRLHRHLFARDPAQSSLVQRTGAAVVVCRSSQAKEPRRVAGGSLCVVPADAAQAGHGGVGRGISRPQAACSQTRRRRSTTPSSSSTAKRVLTRLRVETETDDQALDRFAPPFAEEFLVSPIAMRIRLEKLGLLHREVPLQRLLAGGA